MKLYFKQLQAVRRLALGGKFYRLPPDKENTENLGDQSPSGISVVTNILIPEIDRIISISVYSRIKTARSGTKDIPARSLFCQSGQREQVTTSTKITKMRRTSKGPSHHYFKKKSFGHADRNGYKSNVKARVQKARNVFLVLKNGSSSRRDWNVHPTHDI